MSELKTVVDNIETALEAISGIGLITREPKIWAELNPSHYPAIMFQVTKPEVETIAFWHATANDSEATAEVTIQGVVYSQSRSTLESDITDLMSDAETAMYGLILGDVIDVVLLNDEYDYDRQERYGVFQAVYQVKYLYNHNSP